jgi:hypothetical protein
MKAWLKKIKISAILISFLVFVIALLGANYARTNLFLKKQVKAYVVENMPQGLTAEERQEKARSLYFEFMAQPNQKAFSVAVLMIAFLVSGYAAGTMSDSHINAAVAGIAGALVFLSQIGSGTYWMTILLGFIFCMAGSKIGIWRKQKMGIS